MRPCPVCGTPVAETDDFCGNCGSYLDWSLPATGESTVDQPKPVRPAVPIAPRQTRETTIPEPKVDGPPCPNCGTANPPGRRYCRRCAYALSAPEEPEPPRRRRFGRDGSGRLWRALVLLSIVVVLVVAGFALRPLGARFVQDVLDKISQPAPVHPVDETASAAVAGHPASAAVDGATNQYWGAPGADAWIEFRFDHPFRLLSLIITSGASTAQDQYAAQGRPTQFDLVVTASDGTVTTVPAPLRDQPGPQTVQTGISDVVRIRMVIRTVAGLPPGRLVALGEVEFFQRS
jgi:predicted nucleic acid-binding Zn ribbon protein